MSIYYICQVPVSYFMSNKKDILIVLGTNTLYFSFLFLKEISKQTILFLKEIYNLIDWSVYDMLNDSEENESL